MNFTRRDFLVGSAAMAAGASVSAPFILPGLTSIDVRSGHGWQFCTQSITPRGWTRSSPPDYDCLR